MLKLICVMTAVIFCTSVTAQDAEKETEIPQELEELSGAEILIRLQKYIANDEQRLIQLENNYEQLQQETEKLTAEFNTLDSEHQKSGDAGIFPSENTDLAQRWEYIRKVLDLHLQSRQAVQQQINVLEKKIEKQKEVVNFITIGQIPISDDTVELPTQIPIPDTTVEDKAIPEIQHRKVLEALDELERLEEKLALAKHSLLLVEQLMRLNTEDLELAKAITEASAKQLAIYEEQLNKNEDNEILRQRLKETAIKLARDSTLVHALNERIKNLETILIPVMNSVNTAEQEVDAAREHVEFLQSPLAPHRISYWLKYNLPRIIIIIGILLIIWLVTRWVTNVILTRLKRRRLAEEHLERIETLKLASSSIITIIIVFIGFLILMSELGVDLTVVLGGAAVLSLVIAFGAQSLVKDYFSGFMILLENQYRVGNVVKINNTSGVVENMSLRLTLLRDLEGVAHFIPHGQINEVSNLTHGWSQIAFDIGVSYNENVDYVIKVLTELAHEIKEDPHFGLVIHGEPDMLGVDAFTDSAVIIKFLIKTRPLKQWMVKRELLRRIKNRFDELGIEIPFPHLTVYHRNPGLPETDNNEDKLK